MSTRYATIIENDEGQEIISNIAQVEGGAPEVSSAGSRRSPTASSSA